MLKTNGVISYIKCLVYNTENPKFICLECRSEGRPYKKIKRQMANIWICRQCWTKSLMVRKYKPIDYWNGLPKKKPKRHVVTIDADRKDIRSE